MLLKFIPQKIYIDEDVANLPFSQKIQSKFPNLAEIIDIRKGGSPACGTAPTTNVWRLTRHKGKFLRLCPGTRNYLCCNYWIINMAHGCPFSCSYCALQTYEFPYLNIFANINDMFTELEDFLNRYPDRFFRIGTGEFTDSLALDNYLDVNKDLVNFFSERKNAVLELKTKSDNVGRLLSLCPKENIIISWSLNTSRIIREEERGAPGLEERLAAARKCQEKGYWIGFHFDPLINYDNWEKEYGEVIEKIFQHVNSIRIAWISLGALRFVSGMEENIKKKAPATKIIYGELIPGLDNKMRYFKPIRIEMFKKLADKIKKFDKGIPVYLCMESPEVWEKTLGWRPKNNVEIDNFVGARFPRPI
ncbi:MAG: radical SAM protein [bacterium]